MRKEQAGDLRQLIGYMQDTEGFASKFRCNMSPLTAEVIGDDLESYYGVQHPDSAESHRTEKTRKTALNILNIANKLHRYGEISAF